MLRILLIQFRFYCFLLSLFVSLKAQTQNIPEAEANRVRGAIERLRQQEDQARLRSLENQDRKFKKSKHGQDKKKKNLGKDSAFRRGRQCVLMNKVSLRGDPLLKKRDHNALIKDFTKQCIGPAEINYLIRKVTNFYIERGYITTRIYIPPQDLNDGSLALRIIPGTIASIQFKDKNGYRSEIFTAFPFLEKQYLNLRHIEQGLEQINRLSSNNVRMNLKPGKKAGSSHVIMVNQEQKFWNTSLNLSNSGSKFTGRTVASGSLTLDNLMLINDVWTFGGSHSVPGNNNLENKNVSNYIRLSFPFGYWLFSYFTTTSNYQTIQGNTFKYKQGGNSEIKEYSIDRVLYRTRKSKTTLSGSTSEKGSTSFYEFSKTDEYEAYKLNFGAGKTNTNKMNIAHSHYLNPFNLQFGIGYRFGRITTAPSTGTDKTMPDNRFQKIEYSFSSSFPFALASQNFNWQLSYEAQYTTNKLTSEEQMSIGGLYTIRGFQEQSLSADIGYVFRNELHWYPRGTGTDEQITEYWGSPSFFIAYDEAQIEANKRTSSLGYLSGLAIGVQSYGKYANFSFTMGRSLRKPSILERLENTAWFSLGFRF